jgi:serine O-acetyltransferase
MKEFTKGMPAVRALLQADIKVSFGSDPSALSREEMILSYPCIEAISMHRLAHKFQNEQLPVALRL